MSWSPAVNEFVLRLADDDAAVRDAALEEALGLNEADLTLVSSIDQHLSSWRASGRLQRHGGRLTIGVPTRIVDDTVTRLVAVLRPHVLGLYDDVAPTGPRPRVLPAGWGHAGLVTLSTTWPLASVEGLGGLTWLNMDNAGLEEAPRGLGTLSRLEHLSLRGNMLTSLPAELGRLEMLQELDVSDNRLTSLPAEIGGLRSLRRLNAPRNQLGSLPASVGELESLEELVVNANQLTSLPSTIGRLQRLRELRLAGNLLTGLPDEVVELPALEDLSLYRNQLTSLPRGLGRLDKVIQHGLRFTHNRLESLPEELGDPPSLLLGHNPLRQLPIAQLMAMRRLNFLVVDEDAPLDEASQTWLRELYRNKPRLEYINDDPDADDDDPRYDPH